MPLQFDSDRHLRRGMIADPMMGDFDDRRGVRDVLAHVSASLWEEDRTEPSGAEIGEAREIIEDRRIDYNTARPHSSLKYRTPEAFAAARAFDKTQWAQPNDGNQKENRLDLRVALQKGAGQQQAQSPLGLQKQSLPTS